MGILNLTPDSYYEPSRFDMSVLDSSADIVDIGACSTRPGSVPVSEEEEWSRLEPVLRLIARDYPSRCISIDTFRPAIVSRAYDIVGPFIVNDISAGEGSSEMLPLVASLGLRYVAMHHGESLTGGSEPVSGDVTESVYSFFESFAEKAESLGIDWILDPGFGFGKSLEQNWSLLESLDRFRDFGREILVSLSRKRMIYESIGSTADSPQTLLATCDALQIAVNKGAGILRVHDVDYFCDFFKK